MRILCPSSQAGKRVALLIVLSVSQPRTGAYQIPYGDRNKLGAAGLKSIIEVVSLSGEWRNEHQQGALDELVELVASVAEA